MQGVRLATLIAKPFHHVWAAARARWFQHFMLAGGRGSAKSSFISIAVTLLIMRNKGIHAVLFRKTKESLKDSVFNQMIWAINILGVHAFWKVRLSPLMLVYVPTGQRVLFRGMDDPNKAKSIKMPFGYIGVTWFEELDQFDGISEIRKVLQSTMRGGEDFWNFYSFNPPNTASSWVNSEFAQIVPNRLTHHSTYHDVPRQWLGEAFLAEADMLQRVNPLAYENEYLGKVTGTGGAIFTNLTCRKITDAEIKAFCNLREGLDWGYAIDPLCWLRMNYDKTRKALYIFDEIYGIGILNDQAAAKIRAKGDGARRITADSAEPKSIRDLETHGLRVRGAKKGKDSVSHGIKALQGLHSIVIDSERCPNAWREFSMYELAKSKDGRFINEYPDADNHSIDTVRYALEDDLSVGGVYSMLM